VPRGFDLVAQYRQSGFRATAEMCVHYLLLDAARDGDRLGGLMKVNPPIRSGVSEALWDALAAGKVNFVSSDHSGWPLERKTRPSIFDVSAGVPGLETLLPGFYTGAEAHGAEALSMCARYLSEGPAKFFGLWPRKGALAVGADADVAVLSLGEWRYEAGAAQDELNWSPFDGARFTARVTSTYLRGMVALDALESRSVAGMGRFCPRAAEESLLF
jgi:allantoinase